MAARIRLAPACPGLSQIGRLSRPRGEEDTTMRIFIAGATGTLGRPVVRRLVSLGHEVTRAGLAELSQTLKGAAGWTPPLSRFCARICFRWRTGCWAAPPRPRT